MRKLMRRRSRFFLALLVILLSATAGGIAYFIMNPDKLEQITGIPDVNDPLDTIFQLFGAEPSEVRELRKAEVPESDPGHYEYYFKALDGEEKRCYREILNGIREHREQFYITLAEDERVNHVYKAVLFDHPELYWVHNREHVYRTVYGDSGRAAAY